MEDRRSFWTRLGERVHLLHVVAVAAIAVGSLGFVTAKKLGDVVTKQTLEQTLAPMRQHLQAVDDLARTNQLELATVKGQLDYIAHAIYQTGRQVGAPVLPPHTADAGVP